MDSVSIIKLILQIGVADAATSNDLEVMKNWKKFHDLVLRRAVGRKAEKDSDKEVLTWAENRLAYLRF